MKYAIVHPACEKCQGQENSCQAFFALEEEPEGKDWYWTNSYSAAGLFWQKEHAESMVERLGFKKEWIQEVPDEKARRAQDKIEKCS